jgi:hypothetical protein
LTYRERNDSAYPLLPQRLVEPGGAEEDVEQAAADGFGAEGLGAHCRVGAERFDDRVDQPGLCVDQLGLEGRRVGELHFGFTAGLLPQCFELQQLPFNDIVDADQLVVLTQIVIE